MAIQWLKDRRELKSSGNTRITFVGGTASLEVSPVSKTDAGDYLCKASNAAGSNFCKSRVTVKGEARMCVRSAVTSLLRQVFSENTHIFILCWYLVDSLTV